MNLEKEVILGKPARQTLISGLNTMADAVKCTLGPKGNHVIILTSFETPHITKDGVTVARSVKLPSPSEDLGAKVLLQAAEKTVKEAGDGTTTAIILAQAMVQQAFRLIDLGIPARQIREYFQATFTLVVDYIRKVATPVANIDDVYKIAYTSSNQDANIADLIKQAYSAVGLDGCIATIENKTNSCSVDITSGLRFEKGYVSSVFINNRRNGTIEYSNPYIFLYDASLRTTRDVAGVLNIAAEKSRPLIIIADEIEGQALGTVMVNYAKAGIPVACVKAPSYGENRYDIMADIATYTGGKVISPKAGGVPSEVTEADLGQCDRIIINQTETTIIGPYGSKEKIEQRIEQIKGQYENAPTNYHKDKALERIAMLKGSIATIFIGAPTDVEAKELRDRMEDTILACRSAIEEGYIVGAGRVLYDALNVLPLSDKYYDAIRNILLAPLKVLVENCSDNFELVLSKLDKTDSNMGYDANTGQIVDLHKANILDPAKVLISAINNAFSVSSLLLSTNAIVIQPSMSREDV